MQEQYQIVGEVAGKIYHSLEVKGALEVAALQKEIEVSDSALVQQALGWLAREDKINFDKKGKAVVVSLLGVQAAA